MTANTDLGPDLNVTLRGEAELLRRAGHLFEAREEFACAARDLRTWGAPEFREELVARRRRAVVVPPVVRKLYNPEVLADEASERHLLEVSRIGVDVRICTAPLAHETIIVDRRVAFLAGPARGGVREYTVVRSPAVVEGVCTLLQAAWDRSVSLADHRRDRAPALSDESRRILRVLADGLKDEAAARRLEMSLRTYRRRVAEILTLLDAESRFQAGLRAHELGLLT